MDDHALVVIAAILAFVTVALALVGVGVAALAVPSHPDRAKAAKVFFSLAAVVFAGTIVFWTISKGYGLGGRIVIDLVALCLITIGTLAGFRFADRSALAELSLPASAILPEPFFSRTFKVPMLYRDGLNISQGKAFQADPLDGIQIDPTAEEEFD